LQPYERLGHTSSVTAIFQWRGGAERTAFKAESSFDLLHRISWTPVVGTTASLVKFVSFLAYLSRLRDRDLGADAGYLRAQRRCQRDHRPRVDDGVISFPNARAAGAPRRSPGHSRPTPVPDGIGPRQRIGRGIWSSGVHLRGSKPLDQALVKAHESPVLADVPCHHHPMVLSAVPRALRR